MPGTIGMDLSLYQCSRIPPPADGVAVVQVTGGAIDNPPNPCYLQEAAWAGNHLSLYLYMDGMPLPPPAASASGAAGPCPSTAVACTSYNYGWTSVRRWVAYSTSLGIVSQRWWIDVEADSGWKDPASNQMVIQGALDGLRSEGVTPGIYSNRNQWDQITGGMAVAGVDEWVPGAGNLEGPGYTAANFCAAPGAYTFGGGRLRLVQYGYQGPFPGSYSGPLAGYDLDLAC